MFGTWQWTWSRSSHTVVSLQPTVRTTPRWLSDYEQKQREQKQRETDEKSKSQFSYLASQLHHLVSTQMIPGVYNPPYSDAVPTAFGVPIEQHLRLHSTAEMPPSLRRPNLAVTSTVRKLDHAECGTADASRFCLARRLVGGEGGRWISQSKIRGAGAPPRQNLLLEDSTTTLVTYSGFSFLQCCCAIIANLNLEGRTLPGKIRGGPPQPLAKRKPLLTRTANAGRMQVIQGPFRQKDQIDLANAKSYDQ